MTMRFALTAKIAAGVGLIVLIGMASVGIVYLGLASVGAAMRGLVETKEPASAAAYEMEIQVHALAASVLRYLDTAAPRSRAQVDTDHAKFTHFHGRYLQLVVGSRGTELGKTIGPRYGEFKALGDALMTMKAEQEGHLLTIAEHFDRMDKVIDERLDPASRGDRTAILDLVAMSRRREALMNLEAEIAEVGLWLANYTRVRKPEYRDRIFARARDVRAGLAQLRRFPLFGDERRWTAELATRFEATMSLIRRVLILDQRIHERAQLFTELQLALDRLLDDEIQVLAKQELVGPREAAERATSTTVRRVQVLVPLLMASAVVVALVLVHVVRRPVRALMSGTAAIGRGDLSHRIRVTGGDELADLATDFNRMVDQLERTTVSKARLEESEQQLKQTVARLRQEITEREKAESEQARLQASLLRAETMSAMGALVAGVAHEVRNPLFGISSVLDAMEARAGARDGYERHIAVLRSQVGRLTGLMQALLEYGKPATTELAPAPIDDVIRGVVQACRPLAEQCGVRIDDDVDLGMAPVLMVRTRLSQVFANLLENAIQHSPPGGAVSLRGRRLLEDDQPWVECALEDEGPGIAREDLPRLFDPFFTRRRGGTGLGLSIVQRIVDEHGGRITAGNRPHGGAVMAVRFPIVRA
jgi:nitrogen-specific signal transduction histidine kinase